MQRLYTVKQVARKLCVHERTVWRWMDSGALRSIHAGKRRLIGEDDIAAFLRPVNLVESEQAA